MDTNPNTETLTGIFLLLQWLATSGGAAFAVGYALSLIAENIPAWHRLPSMVKTVVPLIAAPLVAVGATLILKYPTLLEMVGPWYTIVMGAVLAWLGSQNAYMKAKSFGYGAKRDAEESEFAGEMLGRFQGG
jgi:hypothetical protein